MEASFEHAAGILPSPREERSMPSMMSRLARFARSPQGRKIANQAQRWASDPKNRQKIEGFRKRLASRRTR
jgi:hypothetical protein